MKKKNISVFHKNFHNKWNQTNNFVICFEHLLLYFVSVKVSCRVFWIQFLLISHVSKKTMSPTRNSIENICVRVCVCAYAFVFVCRTSLENMKCCRRDANFIRQTANQQYNMQGNPKWKRKRMNPQANHFLSSHIHFNVQFRCAARFFRSSLFFVLSLSLGCLNFLGDIIQFVSRDVISAGSSEYFFVIVVGKEQNEEKKNIPKKKT